MVIGRLYPDDKILNYDNLKEILFPLLKCEDTSKGQWVMKQTDWEVLDEVPDAVYHTFTFGPYSTDEVLDVTYVEFPDQPAQIVVCIGIDNEDTEYQLFYRTDGELINARNVTYRSNILGASTFL